MYKKPPVAAPGAFLKHGKSLEAPNKPAGELGQVGGMSETEVGSTELSEERFSEELLSCEEELSGELLSEEDDADEGLALEAAAIAARISAQVA